MAHLRTGLAVFSILIIGSVAVGQAVPAGPDNGKAKEPSAHIQRLIDELENAEYKVRALAQLELAKIGVAAVPALREAIRKTTSAEVRSSGRHLVLQIQQAHLAKLTSRAKAATGLLEVPVSSGGFAGKGAAAPPLMTATTRVPAVCIHPSGFFLTGAGHVRYAAGKSLSLTLDAGLNTQRIVKAKVVRSDMSRDLALVQVEVANGLTAVELGDGAGISELVEVAALTIATAQAQNVEVLACQGVVTSVHLKDGLLSLFEIEGEGIAGSIIGPLVDAEGKLIGLGASRSLLASRLSRTQAADVNLVVAAHAIKELAAQPIVRFSPPVLRPGEQHQAVEFTADLLQILPSSKPLDVELVLLNKAGQERRYKMKLEQGVYKTKAVLAPAPETAKVRIAVDYPDARIETELADQVIRLGNEKIKLSEITALRINGDVVQATLATGATKTGPVAALAGLTVQIGSVQRSLQLSKAVQATIQATDPTEPVACSIVVNQDDRELVRYSAKVPASDPGNE